MRAEGLPEVIIFCIQNRCVYLFIYFFDYLKKPITKVIQLCQKTGEPCDVGAMRTMSDVMA